MPVNPFALTEGVPTGRVGKRLVQARRQAGMRRWHASRAAQVSHANLARIERGRVRPPDGTVIALCRTYDVAVPWLVPERSGNTVVVGGGRVEVAGRSRWLTGGEGDHAVEAVLGSYLAIVRELRGAGAGVVSLRDEDLVALARALGDTPSEIEARLVDLMKLSREEARAVRRELLKRRVAVPAAGLLLAAAAVTGSLDGGSGGAADRAGGGTFAGARAEHTVDQGAAGDGGAAVSLGDSVTGGSEVAAPGAHRGGPGSVPNVPVDGGDDVVIGDAVSFVRDTPPPAPRVVIPLPAVSPTPAAGGAIDAPDAPDAPTSDGTITVTDPGTGGAPGGGTGTVDPGTGTGGGTNGGTAAGDDAHGANDNANPNAADAGANADASGGGAGGVDNDPPADPGTAGGTGNAHGGNELAGANAADAAGNGGAGNESAGAASPSSNGNGASNAHGHA